MFRLPPGPVAGRAFLPAGLLVSVVAAGGGPPRFTVGASPLGVECALLPERRAGMHRFEADSAGVLPPFTDAETPIPGVRCSLRDRQPGSRRLEGEAQ